MPCFSQWTLLLFLAALSTTTTVVVANKHHNAKTTAEPTSAPAPAPYIQLVENYVDSNAAVDVEGILPAPLKVSYWTTPHRDWDSTLLLRLRGLVMRFQNHLLVFHPHQGIMDGSLIGCHDPTGGPTDIAKLSDTCLDNCVNAGRYCAVFFPQLPVDDDDHAGLLGADLVMESARRLCLWIVYGQKEGESYKYFDYMETLRETNCDRSLSDNCIDQVYRQVGIDDSEMAKCLVDAGGIGSQVDMRNEILNQEMHRSDNMNLTYDALPRLALNGLELANVTSMSDWQIMAEVCTAFAGPKPQICDFCLRECPIGNDDHDPTLQCIWDLTCGDDRTFDDWMQGTGFFANLTLANNTATMDETDDPPEDKEQPETDAPTTETPTVAPTAEETDDSLNDDVIPDDLDNTEDTDDDLSNSTNITTPEDMELPEPPHNDTNATLPPHHNNNKPHNHHHKTSAPTTAPTTAPQPTPAPHHSKPTYNSPIAPLQPVGHHSGGNNNHYAPTTHGGKGNTHNNAANPPPQQKKAPNTTTSSTITGLAIAVVCLGGLVALVFVVQRYRSGKDVYATVEHRDASGLAVTASHAAEQDLQLNVEMGVQPRVKISTRSLQRSDGYAPPSSSANNKGTWG